MELPENRYNITINDDGPHGPMEIHIDYFDKSELLTALKEGIAGLGLQHRIFISSCRSPIDQEASEWAPNKD